MVKSDKLFNRQRSLHQILGGGFVADVVLWRRKDLTVKILIATLAIWVVFEKSKYTLLSLISSVLLLTFTILYLWGSSAAILNRPAPPLPDMYISKEIFNEKAENFRNILNSLLSIFMNISLGKDSRMFFKVALSLLLVSIIGSLTDIITLGYAGIVIIFTVPVLYERYEDHIDKCVLIVYTKFQHFYTIFHTKCIIKVQNFIAEVKKLD